jgi:hypothetical protein
LASILVLAIVSGTPALAADTPPDDRTILRYNPVVGALVPVPENEAKPGCVYSHFSERLHRRVWAIRQADGQFSNALGEGTTQPGRALDMRESVEARIEKLQQVNNEVLKRLQRQGGAVYFRLSKDDRWELDPLSDHATIYDPETMFCWEWSWGQYVRLTSAPFAYRWQVIDGRYIPVKEQPSIVAGPDFCGSPPKTIEVPQCPCECP